MNKRPRHLLYYILGNERWQWISIPIFAVILSILAGSVVILLLGKSPIDTYIGLVQGAGLLPKPNYAGGTGMLTDFTSFFRCLGSHDPCCTRC